MPEDERVAGNARVNVPGSSAEPVADPFRDPGSLPVSVGQLAQLARRPARSNDTKDLSARLRSDRRCGDVGRVLNLCEDGMLLESRSDLEALIEARPGAATRRHQVLNVSEQGMLIDGLALAPIGAQISFVLAGKSIDHLGCGRVAHSTDTSAGVAVDHWHGALGRGLTLDSARAACSRSLAPESCSPTVTLWSATTLQQEGTVLNTDRGATSTAPFGADGRSLLVIDNRDNALSLPTSLAAWERRACRDIAA